MIASKNEKLILYLIKMKKLYLNVKYCCIAYVMQFAMAQLAPRRMAHLLVRCLSVLNVHFCKKSPKFTQMTFDRYLSNPDIGRTFWDGLTHSN